MNALSSRPQGPSEIPEGTKATFWESMSAFIRVNFIIRSRDSSFLFIYILSAAIALVYLGNDMGQFSQIKAVMEPTPSPMFNGSSVINAIAAQPGVFNLALSPNNTLTNDIYTQTQYGARQFRIYNQIDDYSTEMGLTFDYGLGYTIDQFNENNVTKARVVSNSLPESAAINSASEILINAMGKVVNFNLSFMGFPHLSLNSEVSLDSVTVLFVYVGFMLISARLVQFYFSLGQKKILFQCKLNKMPDLVLFVTLTLIGIVDHIPMSLVTAFGVCSVSKSTSGANFFLVLIPILLFSIGFWLLNFATGTLIKSDGVYAAHTMISVLLEAGVMVVFLLKDSVPTSTMKLIMLLLPNGGLHGSFLLFSNMKSFYGGMTWDRIKIVASNSYPYSLLDVIICQLINIAINLFLLILFALCASRFVGYPPLGWKNFFNLKKWKSLFGDDEDNKVSLMGDVILELNNLKKTYHGETTTVALDGISTSIKEGEVIILIGPNGSGKSTLFNCMTGSIQLDEGSLMLYNEDVLSDFSKLYSCLGYVAQDNVLFDELTVGEHLHFFGTLRGIKSGILDSDIDYFTSALQLTNQIDCRSLGLSGGEKRKLCIAISLLQRPKILILDEPTAGVDVQSRKIIWKTLGSFKGVTSLISSHALEEAEAVCSRIFVLKSGQFMFYGTPGELRDQTNCGYLLIPHDDVKESVFSQVKSIINEAKYGKDGTAIVFPVHTDVTEVIESIDRMNIGEYSLQIENLEEKLIRLVEEAE